MKKLKKIFLRQSKNFLIIPILVVTVTLIHSKFFEKKTKRKTHGSQIYMGIISFRYKGYNC